MSRPEKEGSRDALCAQDPMLVTLSDLHFGQIATIWHFCPKLPSGSVDLDGGIHPVAIPTTSGTTVRIVLLEMSFPSKIYEHCGPKMSNTLYALTPDSSCEKWSPIGTRDIRPHLDRPFRMDIAFDVRRGTCHSVTSTHILTLYLGPVKPKYL